jgi:hypothetical protein
MKTIITIIKEMVYSIPGGFQLLNEEEGFRFGDSNISRAGDKIKE